MSRESSSPTRGLFIVFEGGDGAGKSTQVALAKQWLESRGAKVTTTREPGGTQISEELRSLVLDHGHGDIDARTEALIYSAARAAHVQQVISPALEAGTHIICDRFVDSSLAYQGMGRALGFDAVASINDFATGGLKPDATIILDISAEQGRARRIAASGGVEQSDRLESEPDDFHERIRHAFLDLASRDPQRYLVLDATASVEQLHQSVVQHLAGLL
ncbi:dTMP kinase [Glutamicibacter sp. HZAU]|uniref:dTMP kinase n=1 Tax=Glutamicibacter sp. HZAU TaxID=2049891 RepID=UPI000FFBD5B4|nr:dTMP kinase [Glutamicibacter sp. HZAU]MDV2978944.1 dTMP kinase [Actinomycetes bacterium ARC8]RWZ79707.1 dTMP kinase [Glutamicibacter sp. HZAU]